MKQVATIKKLRIVQKPLIDCAFQIPDVVNLPFSPFVPVAEQIESLGKRADLSFLDGKRDMSDANEEMQKID